MAKITMIDPPGGWKYGFPKPLTGCNTDIKTWLRNNGYPQHEIDACGDNFFCRNWEEEVPDELEEDIIVLELTKREADAILELACTVSWTMGDYGPEMKAICRALEKVIPDGTHQARAKTWFGDLEVDQVFLVEKD